MLIQVEDKTIVNMQYECEMTEQTSETVKRCKTREEAENVLEQILNQYDRGQRVIKISNC